MRNEASLFANYSEIFANSIVYKCTLSLINETVASLTKKP